MKRIVAIILALLLVTMCLPLQIFAAGTVPGLGEDELPFVPVAPKVMIEATTANTTVHRGETVTVDLKINLNSMGFSTLDLSSWTATDDIFNEEVTVVPGEIAGAWDGLTFTAEGNTTETGLLGTLTFTVKEDAAVGEKELTFEALGLNADMEDVEATVSTLTVFVQVVPTGIDMDKEEIIVKTAENENTATVTAVFTPEDATETEVTWSVDDDTIATVTPDEENGLIATVTGLRKGETTLKVVSVFDGTVLAECKITVECSHLNVTEGVGQKEATCTAKGYTGDKVCDDCGETLESGKDIDMIPHAWENLVKEEMKVENSVPTCVQGTEYYQSCFVCGEKNEEATFFDTDIDADNHSWVERIAEQYKVSDATCISGTVYKKSCERCGAPHETETFNDGVLDPHNHAGTTHLEGKKDPTIDAEGYSGDVICDDCHEIVKKGEVLDKLTFIWGDATGDGVVDMSDALLILQYVGAGGHGVELFPGADGNGDGVVDMSDALLILQYVGAGGNLPLGPQD